MVIGYGIESGGPEKSFAGEIDIGPGLVVVEGCRYQEVKKGDGLQNEDNQQAGSGRPG